MVDRRCKYHISLIKRRWFKEAFQESTNLDLNKEPFVYADSMKPYLDDIDETRIPDNFMDDILGAFPTPQRTSCVEATLVSKKRRYGELTGLSKMIAERVSSDPRGFDRVKDLLTKELASLRGDEEVRDPAYIKGKGRPRVKRLRSAAEPRKGRVRCGYCGREGHNTRTCQNLM
jgi:hypothetical protein